MTPYMCARPETHLFYQPIADLDLEFQAYPEHALRPNFAREIPWAAATAYYAMLENV